MLIHAHVQEVNSLTSGYLDRNMRGHADDMAAWVQRCSYRGGGGGMHLPYLDGMPSCHARFLKSRVRYCVKLTN
jgi:hypothetical protein